MTLVQRPAPHLRHSDGIAISMADVSIVLLPCVAMSCYYYGERMLMNCTVAVLSAVVTELIFSLLTRKRAIGDLSAVVTGLIIAMLLPVGILYRYVVMAAVTSMSVAKAMFGGVGKNIFNPALCGVALVTLVNTQAASTVFEQGAGLPLLKAVDISTFTPVTGMLTYLKAGEIPAVSLFDAFVGRQPEIPAGVCIPIVAVAFLYLVYRKIASPNITLSMLLTVAAIAFFAPRTGASAESVGYELLAGSVIFCSVFCANDPVTTPNTASGQVLFGVFTGAITMLIRYYGVFDEGVIFAILIMNAMSFALDKFSHRVRPHRKGGV